MESHTSSSNKLLMAAFLFLLLICPNQSTRTLSDPLQIAADGLTPSSGHRKLGRAGELPPLAPKPNYNIADGLTPSSGHRKLGRVEELTPPAPEPNDAPSVVLGSFLADLVLLVAFGKVSFLLGFLSRVFCLVFSSSGHSRPEWRLDVLVILVFWMDHLNRGFFVDALYGSASFVCFPELRQCSFRGMPSLWISEEEIMSLAVPFQFALVGFFPMCRPSLDGIRKFFFNLKLHAKFYVTVLDQSHVLIKLSNDLDYSRVFCHRSYLVNNYYMKLTKWSPFLDVYVESPVIPI
ncbi:hypothetical protein M5K25_025289 [Dendrobium thyrsiflorum]|uniref:DUF4283 domain-containing protein n=1 Tax=Dendrobium thyrsiflorum TaxID=117978 RepID=A0ABD0U3R8_DENTH